MITGDLLINNDRMRLLVEDEAGLNRIRTMCIHGRVFLLIQTTRYVLNGLNQRIKAAGRKLFKNAVFLFCEMFNECGFFFLLNDWEKGLNS
jgi:hypothetical protein